MAKLTGSESPTHHLSAREREVLYLATQGCADKEIAVKLDISIATVNSYWVRVKSKLGPHTRSKLICDYLEAEFAETQKSLQEENQRLRAAFEELLGKGANLSLFKENWVTIAKQSADAIVVADRAGQIELVSPAAADMFLYDSPDMIGLNLDALIPEDLREAHSKHRIDYFSNPTARPMGDHMSTPALRRDGRLFPAAIILTPLVSDEHTYVSCLIRDISGDVLAARERLLAVRR